MRSLVLAAGLLGCLAAVAVPAARGATGTALTITYFADSDRREKVRWTLSCAPARGNHPRPAATCRELGRLGWQALRPVPEKTACTDIFGGPQLALVTGRVGGRRVWARLTRTDGCQIERWDRVPSLLPPGGAR